MSDTGASLLTTKRQMVQTFILRGLFLCGFPARQPAGAWRVDPSGALTSDSVLHKPSVVSLYKSRVHGLLMPAQSQRASEQGMARTHQSHASAQSSLSFLISSCLLQTLGGNTLCFCTQTHTPPTHTLHSEPQHACVSQHAPRAEVIPAWIIILMRRGLCPRSVLLRAMEGWAGAGDLGPGLAGLRNVSSVIH